MATVSVRCVQFGTSVSWLLRETVKPDPLLKVISKHAYAIGEGIVSRSLTPSIGGGAGEGVPPLADKGGGQTVSNAPPPPLRRLSGMMPASTDKTWAYIGENVWNTTKTCVKFACNYFWNFSASGDFVSQTPTGALPMDPAGGFPSPDPLWFCPIQTSFRRLWLHHMQHLSNLTSQWSDLNQY